MKKFKEKKQNKKVVVRKTNSDSFDYEECNHTFMAIDSTGKTFACSKCGKLLKK